MKVSDNKHEMISEMINITTRVVTMIFVIITISSILAGDAKTIRFGLEDIVGVLLMGLTSGVGFGVFYIKKNMSAKLIAIVQIFYFLILNAVLLLIGLNLGWFKKEISSLVAMEIMFIVVYFVVTLLVYLVDFNEAKKINQKLNDRKKL